MGKNLGGYNLTQEIVWGFRDTWHIVKNGPCYGLWKGDTFIGNRDKTRNSLEQTVAYLKRYHILKGNV